MPFLCALTAVAITAAPTAFEQKLAERPKLEFPFKADESFKFPYAANDADVSVSENADDEALVRAFRAPAAEFSLGIHPKVPSGPSHLVGWAPMNDLLLLVLTGSHCGKFHVITDSASRDCVSGVWVAVFTRAGTFLSSAALGGCPNDANGGGACGKFSSGREGVLGGDGTFAVGGNPSAKPSAYAGRILPSGNLCPDGQQPVAEGEFQDPKSKESVRLSTECGKPAVEYRAAPDKPWTVMPVVKQDPRRRLRVAQFTQSPANYELVVSEDGKGVENKNPNGSKQKFVRVETP